MTQLEKALERLRARPAEADFEDVRRVLEAAGWLQERQKGSHVSFTREGQRSMTIPLHRGSKVKRSYVADLINRLGLDAENATQR